MVCVITRRSGAHRKGFHCCALRFHPHVTVAFQHATADVSGNRHDRRVRRSVLRKLSFFEIDDAKIGSMQAGIGNQEVIRASS